jgi:hypothetical protein
VPVDRQVPRHPAPAAQPETAVGWATQTAYPAALSACEQEAVLAHLRSDRFVDKSPSHVWAVLLEEGIYLCSISTMYRLLRRADGEVRERRRQATHPARKKPELCATGPNEVWSWDIERREALFNRAEVRDHRRRAIAVAGWKLGAA